MSPDLGAMLAAASREPGRDPGARALWRRGRRRRLARASAAAAGVLGLSLLAASLVSGPTITPVIEPVGQVRTFPPGPGPVDDEELRRWTIDGLGVSLDLPASWTASGDDPLVRTGPSGFVRVSVAVSQTPAAEVCALEVARPASPYGAHPEVRLLVLGGEEACMVRPAVDTAAIAVVAVPLPPDLGSAAGRSYLFLQADADHVDALVRSLRFTTVRE